ncbi:hypothetical protein SAMN02745152_02210 [Treponema berlinense]|uniref:Major outer membrane protein n=1 Tax=Treponema berlinense TaxID=225004 RepID=A0A1T4R5D9_9SPIR|nr:hypothetical protein [Treponema berlinense]SKA10878.1 hypothetical protein SAMN02745152_02210 [Treponema berlinense]
MKKIISALTLGAMVAGAAFADVGVTLNYRQRATLLSHNNEYGTTDEASKILFTDAYSGAGTDNLGINIGGDIASFAITVVGDESTTSKLRTKTLGADLQVGKVGLFAGFWSDGKVKGAYRNKADVDAGNMEGMDFEFKKLGSAYAGSPSFFVDNIVMPVNVTASESYAIGAKYNIRNFKACKLELNGVYISNETSDEKGSKSDGSLQGHSLVGLVEANTNYGTGEFVFKYGQSAYKNDDGKYADAMAFGAYLQPKIMNNLTATIGGAGSVVDGDFTDWSADLRLYYKMGALSFTSFHSYSALVDAEESIGKLNGKKNATTKGIADSAAVTNGKHGGTPVSRDSVLTNNLMVRYKVNSKFAVYGVVADMIGLGENGGKKLTDKDGKETTDALIQLRASAWAQFYAGGNSISVGVVYENYDVAETYGDSVQNIAIPMIFRVKM